MGTAAERAVGKITTDGSLGALAFGHVDLGVSPDDAAVFAARTLLGAS